MAPFAETPILVSYEHRPIEVSKEPDLLDSWWASEHLYALERRAIFSKSWICVTHRSRFIKPGDYISMDLAGFPILIILGKDQIARAFHNVCRHRAYTVTKKPTGSSLILGCRYHGWSYDTRGNLVKAPQFDGILGFDRAKNSLFKIRSCTDRAGFIHLNLDAGQFEHAPDCDEIVRFTNKHNISTTSTWLTGWNVEGAFSWKTGETKDGTGIVTPTTATSNISLVEYALCLFRRSRLDFSGIEALHLTPATTIFVFPGHPLWVMLSILPVSVDKSAIKYDIFTTMKEPLHPKDEEYLRSHLASHVQDLEDRYAALKGSKPTKEPSILPTLKTHLKLERLAGTEILPGRRDEGMSASFCKAEKVCQDLDALAKAAKTTSHVRTDSVQGSMEW